MLNHQPPESEIFDRPSRKVPMSARVALALAIAFSASSARAQECESDADCGFGFRCNHQVISVTASDSTSVATVGGVTALGTTGYPIAPCCGDLRGKAENPEVCPEECAIVGTCEGVSCGSDSECAEGYSCQPEHGIYSTTTTGSDGPLCGDRTCEDGEEACATDCSTELTCQRSRCETDADCEQGFYCDSRGGSAAASVSGSSGGSGGGSGTIELYQSDCLPLPTDGAGGSGGVSGYAIGGSGFGVVGGSDTGTDGGSGFGVVGGSDTGTGGSHDGNGDQPPWPHRPRPGCALVAAPSSGSPLLTALAGLFAYALRQRRRRDD